VTNSKNAMTYLNEKITLGEKILKTAELCRRLETEREKVIPFYESTVDDSQIPEELKLEYEGIMLRLLVIFQNYHLNSLESLVT
jgi:hypothetical protein